MKLLSDECLSPALAVMARTAGHHESTCVRDRGWQGLKDWELIKKVVAEDFTLVTHNAKYFRGTAEQREKGLHAREAIDAGLVCLNSAYPMDLARQERLFRYALNELQDAEDLTNQALEITECQDRSIEIDVYEIPGSLPDSTPDSKKAAE
jgi:hypothetical protein